MKTTTIQSKSKAASTEQVGFSDGMLVTADDLTAATRYPLDVFRVLTRAYFGCGVVCGLKLGPDPRGAAFADNKRASDTVGSFVVEVGGGVAIDCHGFPLELCGPLRIDLTPDPCACDDPPKALCLAISRATAKAARARDCGCRSGCNCAGDCGGDCGCAGPGESGQCSRVRDGVEIRAFASDDLPDKICRARPREPEPGHVDPATGAPVRTAAATSGRASICECLKACGEGECCGESWVLIGCVRLDDQGVVAIDSDDRRYVKPIECLCADLEEQRGVIKRQADDLHTLRRAVEELQAARKPK